MASLICLTAMLQLCRLSAQDRAILLPQRGPLIIGAVGDADADVILDAPTVSGRHARLELVPTGKGRRQSDFRFLPSLPSCDLVGDGERRPFKPLLRLLGPQLDGAAICRCILTDLGSTNGTWVNRAQLRPHRDTQIRSRDTVAFGDSAVAFRVVALGPENIPSALETAVETLVAYQNHPIAGEQGSRGVSEVDGSLVEKHAELLSQAQSPHSSGTIWLQVGAPAGSDIIYPLMTLIR